MRKRNEYFINIKTGEISKKAWEDEGQLTTYGYNFARKVSRLVKKNKDQKACKVANQGIEECPLDH